MGVASAPAPVIHPAICIPDPPSLRQGSTKTPIFWVGGDDGGGGLQQARTWVDRLNRLVMRWGRGGGGAKSTYPPRAAEAEGPMAEQRRRVKPVASLGPPHDVTTNRPSFGAL